jgi:hypothetical protein
MRVIVVAVKKMQKQIPCGNNRKKGNDKGESHEQKRMQSQPQGEMQIPSG